MAITTVIFDMYGVIIKESKGNFIHFVLMRFPRHGLNDYISKATVSGEVDIRKPDVGIFELHLKKSGKTGSECVFIDNSTRNLEAAESIGMKTILFNRDGVEFRGMLVDDFPELTKTIVKYFEFPGNQLSPPKEMG